MNQKQPKKPARPCGLRGERFTFIDLGAPNNQAPDIDQWPVLWPLTEEDLRMPFGRPSAPPTDTPPPAGG